MNDDNLYEVLSYLCRHEYRRLSSVSTQWNQACSKCTTGCTYAHEIVGSKTSHTCLVHGVHNGALFMSTYTWLKRVDPEDLRTDGRFVHFETPEIRQDFQRFLKDTLGVTYALGGMCCGGKGVKVYLFP